MRAQMLLTSRDGLHSLRSRLGARGLILIGAAVIAAGLALNWSWLVAIGVAPLLLTMLPCVAMCALGLCMMQKSGKPHDNQTAANDPRPDKSSRPANDRADE